MRMGGWGLSVSGGGEADCVEVAGWLRAAGGRRVLLLPSAAPSPLSLLRRRALRRRGGFELRVQRSDATQWRDQAQARGALLGKNGAADVEAVIVVCGVSGPGRPRQAQAQSHAWIRISTNGLVAGDATVTLWTGFSIDSARSLKIESRGRLP